MAAASLCLVIGVVLGSTDPAAAQFVRPWSLRSSVPTLTNRFYPGMAFDSARRSSVLFGGVLAAGSTTNETWLHDGLRWTRAFPANSPTPRRLCAMAFDSARGFAVLFGGVSTPGGADLQTWEWDGTDWHLRLPPSQPSARSDAVMAFDSARGVTVLFGGTDTGGGASNDTWEWNGITWTERFPVDSPDGRTGAAMAYDTARGVCVLFGSGDVRTWEWNGVNWTPRPTANSPSNREHATMVYDSERHVCVLFGGLVDPDVLDETWEYNGLNWTRKFPALSPPTRAGPGMAYDSARGLTVMFGGTQGTAGEIGAGDDRTWKWDGTNWTLTPPVRARTVAVGLDQPLCIQAAPGDTAHIFVGEGSGRVRVVTTATGQVAAVPFLDLSAVVDNMTDIGLTGMTFDPGYAVNGYFYVTYIAVPDGRWVLARYHANPAGLVADPGSRLEMLSFPHTYYGHTGGWLGFSPINGYLYVSSGDGSLAGNDPFNRAQTTVGSLEGKILRLDPSGDAFPADPTRNYGIPPTNPFVGIAGDDEIWSYGLRNPWRCSFDRLTGDLYIGDVGQDQWEELDVEPAASPGGRNYGWRCMEGNHCTAIGNCACVDPSWKAPIFEYFHSEGQSVIGGYVYRGSAIPTFQGLYFFADFSQQRVWTCQPTGSSISTLRDRTAELQNPYAPTIAGISAFGEDAAGELYMCSVVSGVLYKIVPYSCAPVVDLQPVGASVAVSDPITLSVIGAGSDPLMFSWRKNGVPITNNARIQGSQTATLVINPTLVSDSGNYDVLLASPCGSLASAVAPVVVAPACAPDFNGSGSITVQDIFDFIPAWLARLPQTDFNHSGSVTVQDLFDFLHAWFVGCP